MVNIVNNLGRDVGYLSIKGIGHESDESDFYHSWYDMKSMYGLIIKKSWSHSSSYSINGQGLFQSMLTGNYLIAANPA